MTRSQLRELLAAGVGVVVLSWSGRPNVPGTHDTQGISTDSLIVKVMDIAQEEGMEVALHLEPYHGRNALSVSDDFAYIIEKFGAHPALHRTAAGRGQGDERQLPVLYVYDSYRIPVREWQQVLQPMRTKSVRNTQRDVFAIGLWLEAHDGVHIFKSTLTGPLHSIYSRAPTVNANIFRNSQVVSGFSVGGGGGGGGWSWWWCKRRAALAWPLS